MSEFTGRILPESTPDQLVERLHDPEVQDMLNRHLREMAAAGILQAYTDRLKGADITSAMEEFWRESLRKQYADEPERAERIIQRHLLTRQEQRQTLGFETPILVSRETMVVPADEDGSHPAYESTRYTLTKVDMQDGTVIPDSMVEVLEIDLWQESDDLHVSPEAAELVKRHWDEQVAAGVVFKGQFGNTGVIY